MSGLNSRSLSLLGALLLTVAALPARAQVPLSPRSLSMGGAMVAAARGHEAIYLNPANLALIGNPRWSLGIAGVSAGALLEGIDSDDAADLIQYEDLDPTERSALLASIPEEGARLALDVRAPLAALQVGPVGVGVAYVVMGGHSLSRDIIELLLEGYEEGRTDYLTADTRGDRASFWDLALSYGTATGRVSWGVTGHFLRGGSLERTWMTDPRIDLAERDITVEYYGIRTEGGSGFSLDLGTAYQPIHSVTLTAAVTAAYSHLGWSDDLRIRQLSLDRGDFGDGEGFESLLDSYQESERELTEDDAALVGEPPRRFLMAESQLPTTATLGVAWQPLGRTYLVGSYSEDVTDGSLAGRWGRRIGIGAEQGLSFLSGRVGIASDLDGQQMITGGVTLGVLDLGVARLTGDEDGADRDGWFLTLGLSYGTR